MTTEHGIFVESYIPSYEQVSGDIGTYERTAKELARQVNMVFDTPFTALEIGPGNSSIVFCEQLPLMKKLYGVDPENFIFHTKKKIQGKSRQAETIPYVAEMQKRAEPFREKIHVIQAKGEQTPFPKEFFDVILCNHSYHWLDPGKKPERELFDVLKPGGLLLIGTSLHSAPDHTNIKVVHVTSHPLYKKFNQIMDNILEQKGYEKQKRKLNQWETSLLSYGFQRILLEEQKTILIPYTLDQVLSVIKNGARMGLAREYPEVLEQGIGDTVVDETWKMMNPIDPSEKYPQVCEILTSYVFQKKEDSC